jgi:hypothetical protein
MLNQFAYHYSQNWKMKPSDLLIEKYADFVLKKIDFTENDMHNNLLSSYR